MNDVHADIVHWLHNQRDWLQQVAAYIMEEGLQTTIEEKDIEYFAERLKTSDGQQITNHRYFKNLGKGVSNYSDVRLCSIGDIQGIENLDPKTPLNLGTGNLIVIYGHNGSGKSSYIRILRKVCGKGGTPNLKPNVFQSVPTHRQCKISYEIDGESKEVTWIANSDPVEELKSVDTFDFVSANIYLSGEMEVSYTPPEVAFFATLANVSDRVKERLSGEEKNLVSCLPKVPEDYINTQVDKFLKSLSYDSNESDIQFIVQWSESDQKSLEELESRLKSKDPATEAKKLVKTKAQIDQLIETIHESASSVSAQGVKVILEARENVSV